MRRTFAVAALLGLVVITTVGAQQKTPLEATLAALKAKRHAPGAETYKLSVETIIDRSVFSPTGKVITCGSRKELTIDWPSGKFRLHDYNTCDDPYDVLKVFDGTKSHTKFKLLDANGNPKGDWKYGLVTGEMRDSPFKHEYRPIFLNRGVITDSGSRAWYPGHLRFDIADDRFFLHRKDGNTLVVRSLPEQTNQQHYYEYTIDCAKNHAITEMSRCVGNGQKEYSIQIDMKQRGGTWAPASWQVSVFLGAKVVQTTNVTVLDYSELAKPQADLFELVFPEGAKVGRSDYQLTPDKKSVDVQFSEYEIRNGKLIKVSGSPRGSG